MKNRKIPNVYFIFSRSDTWQDPPLSLPWQLDVPTMMMGVDVSHPDPGHQGDSMAAVVSQSTVYIHIKGDKSQSTVSPHLTSPHPTFSFSHLFLLSPHSPSHLIPSPPLPPPPSLPFPQVGSLDGRFSQYCGFISAQSRANKDATDVVESLEEATKGKTGNVTNHGFTFSVNIPSTHWLTESLNHWLTHLPLTDSLILSFSFFLFPFFFLFLDLDLVLFLYLLCPFSLSYNLSVSPSLHHFLFLSLVLFLSGLLEVFMSRNKGQMPKQIIIYRDGVSDSQFQSILESELPSIQGMFLIKLSVCCAVLFCAVLYCAVLRCAVLRRAVLCCTALYCAVLRCAVLYCDVLYCTVLYCAVLYCTVLCCTVLCDTAMFRFVWPLEGYK